MTTEGAILIVDALTNSTHTIIFALGLIIGCLLLTAFSFWKW